MQFQLYPFFLSHGHDETDLGSEVLGGRVLVSVVRRNVHEAVDIVFRSSLRNTLDTIDVDIGVGEVPVRPISKPFACRDAAHFCHLLGGILTANKVVHDVRMANALLNRLGVAQVVFLKTDISTAATHSYPRLSAHLQ